MSDQPLFKIGAVSAIVGGSLGLVFNLLHPRTPDVGDVEAVLRIVAESSIWVLDHVVLGLALAISLGGFVAIERSITGDRGRALARLGLAAALVSTAMGLVLLAIDGIAHKQLAVAWLSAPAAGKDVAFQVAEAVEAVGVAIFSLWIIVGFGISSLLFGLAVALGEGYPKWLGWVAALAALGLLVTGAMQSMSGLTVLTTNILFPLFASIVTVWLVIMGFLLWRKASTTTSPRGFQSSP